MTKPFSLEELVARIRAILRRTRRGERTSRSVWSSPISRWTRTPTRCAAAARRIELTATEYKLLRYLMLNPRRVLSKAQILDHVWNYDFGGDANVVEIYISYLRKKLDPLGPPLIHTVRGFGYCLRETAGADAVSLRLRLLLALVGLVAVGLLVADAVTYFSLQSFLIARVDQQLAAAQAPGAARACRAPVKACPTACRRRRPARPHSSRPAPTPP